MGAGSVAHGKRKLTVDVEPSTVDELNRQSRLYFGERSKGSFVDEAVANTFALDPVVAGEVYGLCMAKIAEFGRQANEAGDPIHGAELRNRCDAFRALSRAVSRALFDDRDNDAGWNPPDGQRIVGGSEMNETKFRSVKLSGGRFEVTPGDIVVLNPSLEGARARLWAVWVYDVENPCDLSGAANGGCLGPLMAYLSDRDDLWKLGQHKPARFIDEADAEDCKEQVEELQELALDQIEKSGAADGKTFAIGWAMFDMMSPEKTVPMGTSFALAKSDGGE